MPERREIWCVRAGVVPYGEALLLQRRLLHARQASAVPDVLLLLEHPPTYTRGRRSTPDELPMGAQWYLAQGIEIHDTDRGGRVTYHGPGQLVGYPIIDLKRHRQDLHWYLRKIEEALINTLADYGIPGERNTSYTGVWTRGKKIASIGVHARDWVTWHGFALNVTTDLSFFDLIVPCGITGVVMTSIARELGSEEISAQDVRDRVSAKFAEAFDLTAVVTSHSELLEIVA